MKSYLELLEDAASDGDIVAPVASTLGVKRKEAADTIGQMSISNQLELIDDVDRQDDGAVAALADQSKRKAQHKDRAEKLQEAPMVPGQPVQPGQQQPGQPVRPGQPPQQQQPVRPGQPPQQGQPVSAPGQPQQTALVPPPASQPAQAPAPAPAPGQPGQYQNQTAPTQAVPSGTYRGTQGTIGTIGSSSQNGVQNTNANGTAEDGEDNDGSPLSEDFGIGDEVTADGHEGIVRVPAAGRDGDFVGVLQDGNLTMMHKNKVKKNMKETKLDEHVLGMTIMPDLRRMMELAGIQPGKENTEAKKPWEKAEAAPQQQQQAQPQQAPQAQPQQQQQAQPQQAPQAQPQQAPAAPQVQVQEPEAKPGEIDIMVHDVQTGQAMTVAKTAAPSNAAVSTPQAQAPEPVDPLAEIMSSLDTVERCMLELKVGDYKAVRARLDKISNMIFESQISRRRKV